MSAHPSLNGIETHPARSPQKEIQHAGAAAPLSKLTAIRINQGDRLHMQSVVGKTAYIDLTRRTVKIENTPRTLVKDLLGGRELNMA
jgi:hypothetical protein